VLRVAVGVRRAIKDQGLFLLSRPPQIRSFINYSTRKKRKKERKKKETLTRLVTSCIEIAL
jgi:hypothetical protein